MGKSFRDRNDWHDPEEVSQRERNSRINRENKQRDYFENIGNEDRQKRKIATFNYDEHSGGSEDFS